MYPLLKPLLFRLEPETAHSLALRALSFASSLHLTKLLYPDFRVSPDTGVSPNVGANHLLHRRRVPHHRPVPRVVFGLDFPSPVGLAAGFDKNGEHLDALGCLGFGFVEVGTVTPRPQPGNPSPRIFRIPEQRALLNRLGFNNDGVDALVRNVSGRRFRGVLGVNIGKNADTPAAKADDDYLHCFRKVYAVADYVAVNISSPNTKGLRDFQKPEALMPLLAALLEAREELRAYYRKYVPLVVKIAPDLSDSELSSIASITKALSIDGIIATNTTTSRQAFAGTSWEGEAGGISGAPLFSRSLQVVRLLSSVCKGSVAIIACGGIDSGEKAAEMMAAGASLCQIYTGLIYRGPRLISEAIRACE